MRTKQEILEFIHSNGHMVLSTVNAEGKPQSAVVGFGETAKFELIFGTSSISRKAQNISQNSAVSVVIGWDEKGTLQYEGVAKKLTGKDKETYSRIYFDKNPVAEKHKNKPNQCYFLINPRWVRYTDILATPWDITELNF